MDQTMHPFRICLLGLWLAVCVLQTALHAQSVKQENHAEVQAKAPAKILSDTQELNSASAQIVELTNTFRGEQGLGSVSVQPALNATAEYFVNYMATEYKYGHKADGSTPSERAKKHHYDYCLLSENIAYLYHSEKLSPAELADRFHTGWLNSPDHRKNMEDPDVTEIGVAVAQNEKTGYYFAVQLFGRPKSLAIEFTLQNHADATVLYECGGHPFSLPPQHVRVHKLCRPCEIALYPQLDESGKKGEVIDKLSIRSKGVFEVSGMAPQLRVQPIEPKP